MLGSYEGAGCGGGEDVVLGDGGVQEVVASQHGASQQGLKCRTLLQVYISRSNTVFHMRRNSVAAAAAGTKSPAPLKLLQSDTNILIVQETPEQFLTCGQMFSLGLVSKVTADRMYRKIRCRLRFFSY